MVLARRPSRAVGAERRLEQSTGHLDHGPVDDAAQVGEQRVEHDRRTTTDRLGR